MRPHIVGEGIVPKSKSMAAMRKDNPTGRIKKMTPFKLFDQFYQDKLTALEKAKKIEGKKPTGNEECFCICRMDYHEWLLHQGLKDEDNPPPIDWKPMRTNFPKGIPTLKE